MIHKPVLCLFLSLFLVLHDMCGQKICLCPRPTELISFHPYSPNWEACCLSSAVMFEDQGVLSVFWHPFHCAKIPPKMQNKCWVSWGTDVWKPLIYIRPLDIYAGKWLCLSTWLPSPLPFFLPIDISVKAKLLRSFLFGHSRLRIWN